MTVAVRLRLAALLVWALRVAAWAWTAELEREARASRNLHEHRAGCSVEMPQRARHASSPSPVYAVLLGR